MTVEQMLADARLELVRVTPEEALAASEHGAVLVDIREDPRRASDGLIPGAIRVPRHVLEWRADPTSSHPDPALGGLETPLILFCNEGYQSSLAAAILLRLGRNATDLIGGFAAWRERGLPISGRDDPHAGAPRA